MKKALDNTEDSKKEAADALKQSEVAISLSNKKLYEINQVQQENESKLAKLNQTSEQTNQEISSQQKLLSKQLYQQYTDGQKNYLQAILQNKHPSEIARDLYYLSYIAKARADLIKKMQGNLNIINALNEKTALALNEAVSLKQAQIKQREILESQKQDKSKVVQTLSKKIALQRKEIKKLARDERNLSNIVMQLANISRAKIKENTQKPALETANNPPDNSKKIVATNQTEPSSEFSGVSFESLKGKLRLPVKGNVLNRFGNNREDTGISWKGIFIKADEGATVKSVANGRVVFADWLRGFGNLIIIDHGNGFMSLYGNNQALLKSVGNAINMGDAIASVGNTGGNETNGLYYELRRQSKPFDPLSWSNLN